MPSYGFISEMHNPRSRDTQHANLLLSTIVATSTHWYVSGGAIDNSHPLSDLI
jgi:hypothetical protein